MTLITKLIKFGIPIKDLILIYVLYIRSVLEYCCIVWHSSLTQDQSNDLERVQKVAIRTILSDHDIPYETAFKKVKVQSLVERREFLSLRWAKKCTRSQINKHLFPRNTKSFKDFRTKEPFIVPYTKTERFLNSAIPYMTRLLNNNFTK